ncbi:kinase-like domain-containing protein [Rhizophagus irregularis DAOM 181602=DAOM 197198]|nr:kinase-like domain-containing protein [Rhizophagus irregularis DAOM 181602=DAOM 197198]
MVLNGCEKCYYYTCNVTYFRQNFKNWNSGNDDIDFIQDTQLLAHENTKVLEWIPYDRFYNITKSGFELYKPYLIDGNIYNWNDKNKRKSKYACNSKKFK